ncbi:MAG: bacteriohemerythrin [Thermodesulfobacteriota bacterium]
MKVEWSKDLATGIGWQDRQHKELFKRARSLFDALVRGEGTEEVGKLLDFLDEYVVVHFHDEEQAMSKRNYPDTLSHIEEHTEFIEHLSDLKSGLPGGDNFAEEVQTRVVYWLMNHIAVTDKDLGEFLKREGG